MKSIYLTLTIIILFCFNGYSQEWIESLPQDKLQNGELTFYEIRDAFNDYWESYNVVNGYYELNGEQVKAPYWKLFRRWEWYWENRINPTTGEFPETTAYEELQKFLEVNPGSRSISGTWTSMGPNSTGGGYAGLGRLNCVAFRTGDANTLYVGAASGGIWKTTDDGATWASLGDNNAVLGVSDIIVIAGIPDTIYIATGDRDGGSMWSLGGGQSNDNNSVGILKSTDGGITWNTTGLSWTASQKRKVSRMLLDTNDVTNQTLYAATSVGLYKTTNGGTSWTRLTTTNFVDIKFKPGTPSTIHASNWYGDIYLSTNSGVSFTQVFSSSNGRVELAVSANDPTVVYALMDGSGGLGGIYKSTNSGASYSQVYMGTLNLLGWDCSGGDSGDQGSYDLCIAADPNNANNVFVGGVNNWQSTDGGVNWDITNHWSSTCSGSATIVHADKHFLAYQNGTSVLYECNDGGLYKTTNNGASWTHHGSGLVISQIYRFGVAQTSSNDVICGLQDNGTKALLSGTWSDEIGGDGFECAYDYTNHNTLYGELYYGAIRRSTNHGASWTSITSGLSGSAWWCTPFVLDPNVNTTLYIGYQDVFKSTNQGTSWSAISSWGGSSLRSLAVAPSNSNYIYAATTSSLYRTSDGGTSWSSNLAGPLPTGSGYITYISVKDTDPQTVWVSLGGYNSFGVYESTDGGNTWTNISTGLPGIPVMCVIQNKQSVGMTELYAGTDVGVYVKSGSSNWVAFNSGLPNVVVTELDIYYDYTTPDNSRIRAATYGRGLWESDLHSPLVAPVAGFIADDTLPGDPTNWVNFTDQSSYTPTLWSWSISPGTYSFQGGTNSNSQDPTISFNAPGAYTIALTSTNAYGSDTETKVDYIHQGTPGLWTGNTNTDWNTPTNWHNHRIPQSATDVSITTGSSNKLIKTGNLSIGTDCNSINMGTGFTELVITGDLTIMPGKDFYVDPSGNPNINVGGSWVESGVFTPGLSTVIMDGSSSSSITGPTGTLPIFSDDFEGGISWGLSGEFEIAAPGGLGGDHGHSDPGTAYSGSNVLGIDLSGLGSYPGDYEINLGDRAYQAISPAFSCIGYTNVQLNFQRWLGVESPAFDHAYIDISINNGSSWTQIWTNSSEIAELAWGLETIDISSYADNQPQVKLRWCLGSSDGSWQYCGWNIDDLLIEGDGSLPADFYNLKISKSSAGVSTNSDVQVSGTLDIENGATFTIGAGKTINVEK